MADTLESLEIEIKYKASGAASAIKRTTSAIKSLSNETKKAKSPLENFVASLKRIALYRILRGIIKAITQALQEGLQNAYAFSQGINTEGHRFAEAMDAMKSSTTQMKNQLGSAFISLLSAIAPIIIQIVNLVTKLADALAQLFAAFTGKTYLKAANVADKFANTMKAGGAAAKEWKNQLMGFDEINRLNEPNQGGGGGGSPAIDPSSMFEDAPINEKLLAFIDKIKDKLQPTIDRFKESFERLKEAWERFAEAFDGSILEELIVDLIALGGDAIINGLTILSDVLTLIADVLNGDWSRAWTDTKQLLYDVIILVADLMVGLTDLVYDALIGIMKPIDDLLGTDFAGWLRSDKDAFNELYESEKASEGGLFGLKYALGLTEKATESAAAEATGFTEALAEVSTQSGSTEGKVKGIRKAVDWVLDGFRGFGTEVSWIITGLFQPLADLAAWIQHILDGFGLMKGINARVAQSTADGSIYLQGFASGGFPDEGQLFFANENGAELVGTMGGRTAVANNQEITEGIRQAVYDAMIASTTNGNNDVSVRVYLDSREIKAGQQRLNRAWGVG